MEEGLETVTKFVFPQLVPLSLELMLDLKCFYLGKYTIEWPSLKQLRILKCDKVEIVALNELSFPNTDGLGHDVPIQQPFFPIEKVWTCTCFFVDMDIKCLHCIAFMDIVRLTNFFPVKMISTFFLWENDFHLMLHINLKGALSFNF